MTLHEHEDLLHIVAAKLLEKETLEAEEFLELIKEKTNKQPAAKEACTPVMVDQLSLVIPATPESSQ